MSRTLRKSILLGGVISMTALGVQAESFHWASTTDPQTMDPHPSTRRLSFRS